MLLPLLLLLLLLLLHATFRCPITRVNTQMYVVHRSHQGSHNNHHLIFLFYLDMNMICISRILWCAGFASFRCYENSPFCRPRTCCCCVDFKVCHTLLFCWLFMMTSTIIKTAETYILCSRISHVVRIYVPTIISFLFSFFLPTRCMCCCCCCCFLTTTPRC